MQRVFEAVNQSSMMMNQRTNELGAITEAVVELFGAEVVDAKIKEIADRKTLENLDRAKAAVAAGVEKGELVKANAIGDKSLVIGREIETKGEIVFPGQVQLQMSAIKPEFQEKLKGQGAGFQIETPNGGKFEVLEVSRRGEPSPPSLWQLLRRRHRDPGPASEVVAAVTPAETVEQLEKALAPTSGAGVSHAQGGRFSPTKSERLQARGRPVHGVPARARR
jgi:hypothetical protein